MTRKIIHIDMDCFYAAVEMREQPALKNKPLAVGGDSHRRGVIATCNYLAREFGVRSAMATAHAKKLCPDLVLVPARMELYSAISAQIRNIFADYTSLIEPLSLDEAYLDVTDSNQCNGSATLIAQEIRQRIHDDLKLTASAGVAPIKFVAKIASDENKPNGICVITPDQLDSFVASLPLRKIPGVGKVTAEKLVKLGLKTCQDVREYERTALVKYMGKFGRALWDRAHAIDTREVSNNRVRKSIGVERTQSEDLQTLDQCLMLIPALFTKLQQRIAKHEQEKQVQIDIKSLGVKVKFSDFQQTTVEHKNNELNINTFNALLSEAYVRGEGKYVRLIGLVVNLADNCDHAQLSLPL